jgi:CheY-like chemotaxis protein
MCSVLVVEDDLDIRETMRDVLEGEGHRVLTARHGREALELLPALAPPRLVILDLVMPVMDGIEFLRELARRRADDVAVLVVSASSTVAPPPGTPVLRKPVQLETLLERVETLCR